MALVIFAVASGGGGAGGPLNAVAKAAEVTQEESGARVLVHATTSVPSLAKPIPFVGRMTIEGDRAQGILHFEDPKSGRKLSIQMLGDGSTIYMSSSLMGSLPDGAKWMKLELPPVEEPGTEVPEYGAAQSGLKLLENAEGVEKMGEEAIRGVATTHYRGVLPIPKDAPHVRGVHVSPLEVEVWIDAQGRVRRMAILSTTESSDGDKSVAMTMDFVKFGPVPKIEMPDEDEVFDATPMVESSLEYPSKSS